MQHNLTVATTSLRLSGKNALISHPALLVRPPHPCLFVRPPHPSSPSALLIRLPRAPSSAALPSRREYLFSGRILHFCDTRLDLQLHYRPMKIKGAIGDRHILSLRVKPRLSPLQYPLTSHHKTFETPSSTISFASKMQANVCYVQCSCTHDSARAVKDQACWKVGR